MMDRGRRGAEALPGKEAVKTESIPGRLGLVLALLLVTARARAEWLTQVYGPHAEVALLDSSTVQESSGLVAGRLTPGVFWTHNDSGGTARVWAIRLTAADRAAHLAHDLGYAALNGVSNVDWEDIAVGPGPRIYIFDGGDNPPCDRTDKRIHRFMEPAIDPNGPAIALAPAVESIRFEYPDSADPLLPADTNEERFDCETLLVHPATGDIYVVTKRTTAGVGIARVYKLPAAAITWNSPAVHILQFVADITARVSGMPTGGDIDGFGRRVLVRNYTTAYEFTLPAGGPFDEVFLQSPRSISLGGEIQGEGICYAADGGDIYATSEVQVIGPTTCPIYSVPWQLANCRAAGIVYGGRIT
jgi:hypothetical protein